MKKRCLNILRGLNNSTKPIYQSFLSEGLTTLVPATHCIPCTQRDSTLQERREGGAVGRDGGAQGKGGEKNGRRKGERGEGEEVRINEMKEVIINARNFNI